MRNSGKMCVSASVIWRKSRNSSLFILSADILNGGRLLCPLFSRWFHYQRLRFSGNKCQIWQWTPPLLFLFGVRSSKKNRTVVVNGPLKIGNRICPSTNTGQWGKWVFAILGKNWEGKSQSSDLDLNLVVGIIESRSRSIHWRGVFIEGTPTVYTWNRNHS